MNTHDFKDFKGPVPARRHRNPDGTEGGWVADTATVEPTAHIGPYATVFDWAVVRGYAHVGGYAQISGTAEIYEHAQVHGNAVVFGEAEVYGHSKVFGSSRVCGHAQVYGQARVLDSARVFNEGQVFDKARVSGKSNVFDRALVGGDSQIHDQDISGEAELYGSLEYSDDEPEPKPPRSGHEDVKSGFIKTGDEPLDSGSTDIYGHVVPPPKRTKYATPNEILAKKKSAEQRMAERFGNLDGILPQPPAPKTQEQPMSQQEAASALAIITDSKGIAAALHGLDLAGSVEAGNSLVGVVEKALGERYPQWLKENPDVATVVVSLILIELADREMLGLPEKANAFVQARAEAALAMAVASEVRPLLKLLKIGLTEFAASAGSDGDDQGGEG